MGTTTETRITSTQAKDAIYKAHSISSSASEIDGNQSTNVIELLIDGDSIADYTGKGDLTIGSAPSDYYLSALGGFTWGNIMLNQKLHLLSNKGVPGDRTDQLLARIQNSLDVKARYVMLIIGKNDVNQNIASSVIIANMSLIFDTHKANGSIVIATTIIPSASYPSGVLANIITINNWLREQTKTRKDFILVDWFHVLANAVTGAAMPNYLQSDGTHPTAQGALLMGKKFYEVMYNHLYDREIFTGWNDAVTNLITNPYNLGNNGSGISPAWAVTSTATYTTNKIARNNNLEWQEIEVTGTQGEVEYYNSYNSLVSGDVISCFIEFEVDENITSIDYLDAIIQFRDVNYVVTSASAGLSLSSSQAVRFNKEQVKGLSGVIYIPKMKANATTTRFYLKIKSKLLGKIRIGRCRIIKES